MSSGMGSEIKNPGAVCGNKWNSHNLNTGHVITCFVCRIRVTSYLHTVEAFGAFWYGDTLSLISEEAS